MIYQYMVSSARLLDLTLSDLEAQNQDSANFSARRHSIGSSTGKYAWMIFVCGKGFSSFRYNMPFRYKYVFSLDLKQKCVH